MSVAPAPVDVSSGVVTVAWQRSVRSRLQQTLRLLNAKLRAYFRLQAFEGMITGPIGRGGTLVHQGLETGVVKLRCIGCSPGRNTNRVVAEGTSDDEVKDACRLIESDGLPASQAVISVTY